MIVPRGLPVTEAGFYVMSAAEYHADPCPSPSLSASIAHVLLTQSPAHAKWAHPRLNDQYERDDGSNDMDAGTAAHAMLLEGRDDVVVVREKDWRKDVAKEAREKARKAGRVALLQDKYAEVRAMVESAKAQLAQSELAKFMREPAHHEIAAIWCENGLWMRALIDRIQADASCTMDYKSTSGSAEPNSFINRILQGGYDVQGAMYQRGVKALTGVDTTFVLMVQETAAPYQLALGALDPGWQEVARRKLQNAVDQWRQCLAADLWPGYPSRICWLQCPAWAEERLMRKEMDDAV